MTLKRLTIAIFHSDKGSEGMEIEQYTPEGREFAISRKELRALIGRDDRLLLARVLDQQRS